MLLLAVKMKKTGRGRRRMACHVFLLINTETRIAKLFFFFHIGKISVKFGAPLLWKVTRELIVFRFSFAVTSVGDEARADQLAHHNRQIRGDSHHSVLQVVIELSAVL